MQDFQFPRWSNRAFVIVLASVVVLGGYVATMGFVGTHPTTINVGHQPEQPVPFSHEIHAGQLKMDCRYCHTTVEKAAYAAIPPTATCGNCHGGNRNPAGATLAAVHLTSKNLAWVRESLETQKSIPWLKVHELPDFVYFNHSAHVNRGVSCVECHGRIDQMPVVYQDQPLSMKWCLDCHRNPETRLRPVSEVTNLAWNPESLNEVYVSTVKSKYGDLVKHLDTDKNGSLGAEEAKVLFDPISSVDRDNNNQISETELIEFAEKLDKTQLGRAELGRLLRASSNINPSTNCSTCHR
jgi:menaquinone reductase, multiheme cytochrome c subunit